MGKKVLKYLKENFLDTENNERLKKLYTEKCRNVFGDISEEEINIKFEEFFNRMNKLDNLIILFIQ